MEIVKIILDKTNKDDRLIKHVQDRKGHDRRYAIDSSKIQKELGWKPSTTFENGIQKTLEWYLNNWNWVDHILDGSYKKKER